MISEVIENNKLAYIHLMVEAKFGNDPLLVRQVEDVQQKSCKFN